MAFCKLNKFVKEMMEEKVKEYFSNFKIRSYLFFFYVPWIL